MGIIGAIIGLLLGVYVMWLVSRRKETARKARMLTAAQRGRAMEALAPNLLEKRGFRVLDDQVERRYAFTVDGEPQEAVLRADLLAARGGRRYVVEVKTGAVAKPTNRATRRQLLEYFLHYDVHGVLLLDADRDALSTVEFPVRPTSHSRIGFALGVGVGAAVVGAVWWLMR
ncbi:MAG: hypothetical protein H6706_11835 [Myxococcales bacterium]|nr:hypothetical protein [Myxococcales bacterium]